MKSHKFTEKWVVWAVAHTTHFSELNPKMEYLDGLRPSRYSIFGII
jgi:hypothetical protein